MAHPVLWPKKTFFYPVGNTPPFCLTQELAPEENAEILLVACGDPRSILYTVHVDLAPQYRPLDITCCDWEPAVLARNILLFTMIADGVAPAHAWAIFYHFFLDQKSYDVLLTQCRALVETSSNMKAWKASKYHGYLRFCTDHSLAEIRRHWSLYLETDNLSDADKKDLRASFISGMKSVLDRHDGDVITSMRSAGPLFLSLVGHSAKSYTAFWSTGITQSNTSQPTSLPHTNPTFTYSLSGKRFNVHYGTDPLLSFHLAPALTSVKGVKTPLNIRTEDIVECAMGQFNSWYSSFQKRISAGLGSNITIRFFVGESLAFCQALHTCKEGKITKTGIYAHPWGGSQIDFDNDEYSCSPSPSAPVDFNVIETSNLTDHTGLLNVLLVTVPLLQRKACSVIYTNTLLRQGSDESSSSGLEDLAFGDIPTLSLMLGVAPSAYLSHFTTHSNKHELVTSSIMTSRQFHEFISWKIPTPVISGSTLSVNHCPVTLGCNAKALGDFFFNLYLRMFDEENLASNLHKITVSRVVKQSTVHYVRKSMALFLAFLKERVEVDWGLVMKHFIDLYASDRSLLVGSNNCQDLLCHLYMLNVYRDWQPFQSTFLERSRKPHDCFQGWSDIPSVVCVVLKVPRRQLKALEDIDPEEIGVPMLQCEMRGPSFHNIHSSIQLIFGDFTAHHAPVEPCIVISEDKKGWSGNSPLIVTFFLPSWVLLARAPRSFQVGLHVRSTPSTVHKVMPILGSTFTIYSTNLADSAHIQIVRNRPNIRDEINHLGSLPALPQTWRTDASPSRAVINFDASSTKAMSLTIRHSITDTEATASLSGGATVTTKQVSDTIVLANFKDYTQRFIFPFPIHGNQTKLRIARKSSYLEIEVPIRPNFEDFLDLSLNPFPVAQNNEIANLLNIHYINLDLPFALQFLGTQDKSRWLSTHLAMTWSEREKMIKKRPRQEDRGVLFNLKESIVTILIKNSGLHNEKYRPTIFGLSNPTNGVGVYALIFVNDIKLDLPSHTVVIDACVVPFYRKLMPKISSVLQKLTQVSFNQILTFEDEARAWKMLLPALAERCRTWKHSSACEYLQKGIPVTLDGLEESPLCSCGRGRNLGQFGKLSEWRALHPEATRIAIGPLFTASFMDSSLGSFMRDEHKKSSAAGASSV
ncbi:hypothetical protein GALMADRAFT_56123 [Galerina marginata CBS 339.88]|uniref:DUF4470 domain-containing protein n=1 Tax=Galerina marginata (strain CBS 339.88) TaxID=685588 RepID=A0A067TYT6_GALM3|nr:hypothetical protein GALMADRAFT_56123 [Galerina marginata CBS 339.88]